MITMTMIAPKLINTGYSCGVWCVGGEGFKRECCPAEPGGWDVS